MSLVRPEVRAALYRWREALVGLAAVAVGLWWASTALGAVFLIGCALALAGTALVVAGIQRGRFRSPGGGSGVVDIDERRITYFGPFSGGSVAVDDILEVGIDPSGAWLIRASDGSQLTIPMNAEGADALFDAFSLLPGLTGASLVEARRGHPQEYTVLWAKPHRALH